MALSNPTRDRIGRAVLATALCAIPTIGNAQSAKPFAEFSNSALTLRDSVVAIARAQVGKRYRTGGTTPDRGFDCSGLVKFVLESIRIELPRTAREQSRVGAAVPRDTAQLLAGDVLLFGKPKSGVSHVGIYIGNGRFVHASSVAGRVIESPIDRPPSPLVKIFKSARRIVGSDTVAVATTVAAKVH
jgi:cell wall-associated NlpC family hydrolase